MILFGKLACASGLHIWKIVWQDKDGRRKDAWAVLMGEAEVLYFAPWGVKRKNVREIVDGLFDGLIDKVLGPTLLVDLPELVGSLLDHGSGLEEP